MSSLLFPDLSSDTKIALTFNNMVLMLYEVILPLSKREMLMIVSINKKSNDVLATFIFLIAHTQHSFGVHI